MLLSSNEQVEGVRLEAEPSSALEVLGDAAFPVNNGQMCIKGWTAAALLNHPERLTSPLVRGSKGDLRSATWEEALDFAAQEFLRIRCARP